MWILAFLMLGIAVIAGVFAETTGQHAGQAQAAHAGVLITYAKAASAYITQHGEPANGTTVPYTSMQLPPGTIVPSGFSNIEYDNNFYVWGPSSGPTEVAAFVRELGSDLSAGQVESGRIVSPVGGDMGPAPSQAPNGYLIVELSPSP